MYYLQISPSVQPSGDNKHEASPSVCSNMYHEYCQGHTHRILPQGMTHHCYYFYQILLIGTRHSIHMYILKLILCVHNILFTLLHISILVLLSDTGGALSKYWCFIRRLPVNFSYCVRTALVCETINVIIDIEIS